ncbi:HAD hydrolase-like protein [Marinimicrobium alkaliphilum]|uniref:HAD hydrolase-like protein n=1 Tax=Marinimicrobium alkaliphilum TaxID=2202654 RepID=UPI000DB98169|nr:HAD hydrolase-like protein [Marinimicrobium alkaliphilum]
MSLTYGRVAAFVPLKLNSRRLPNKNFLKLGGKPLASHIFETLTNVQALSSVYCYTSQPQVLGLLPQGVELLMRPKSLDGDAVKANELFEFAVEKIDAEVIVLCHATGPYISPDSISRGLSAVMSGEYDCAFSVQSHKTYSWFKGKPLNYDPSDMIQTQLLDPVFCETSGFYIFRKSDYLERGTRIGEKPFLVDVGFKEAIDIDEPKDFKLAMHMFGYNPEEEADFSGDRFYVDMASMGSIEGIIEHVAFDLDGVLIDSLPLMEKSWMHAMNKLSLGYKFDEYKKGIGKPFGDILSDMGIPEKQHDDIRMFYNEFSMENRDLIQINPAIIELLGRLKRSGVKLSVVTSKERARAVEIIRSFFGDEIFDCHVSPEDVSSGRGKPSPDPLLLSCAAVGVDPYKTIYVGDMEVDKESAHRAGVHFVYANWGYGDLSTKEDVWFDELQDLVDYLESIISQQREPEGSA